MSTTARRLPRGPHRLSRAIVVAAIELTTQYIREDRVSSLPELEEDVLYLWLMVLAGHEVAATALATKAATTARWSRRGDPVASVADR